MQPTYRSTSAIRAVPGNAAATKTPTACSLMRLGTLVLEPSDQAFHFTAGQDGTRLSVAEFRATYGMSANLFDACKRSIVEYFSDWQ